VLSSPVASAVAANCRAQRLVLNAVAPDVLRLAPPLTISAEEVEAALSIIIPAIDAALAAAAAQEEER
jgi:acetylornithine/N-succinyldiaminopimelate aminotransferase